MSSQFGLLWVYFVKMTNKQNETKHKEKIQIHILRTGEPGQFSHIVESVIAQADLINIIYYPGLFRAK